MTLKGKTALVTGSTSGIGLGIALIVGGVLLIELGAWPRPAPTCSSTASARSTRRWRRSAPTACAQSTTRPTSPARSRSAN